MIIRSVRICRLLTIILVISLSQVYVQANLPKTVTNKSTVNPANAGARPAGRLTADGPVTVNGNKARTGDTIFPGAVIETPDGVGATVQLGALGQLDLSPGSRLTLSF